MFKTLTQRIPAYYFYQNKQYFCQFNPIPIVTGNFSAFWVYRQRSGYFAGYGDGKIDRLINMLDRSVTLTLEPHLAVFDAFKSIDKSIMKHKFKFENNEQAFTFAVNALKELLSKNGYVEKDGYFIKNV